MMDLLTRFLGAVRRPAEPTVPEETPRQALRRLSNKRADLLQMAADSRSAMMVGVAEEFEVRAWMLDREIRDLHARIRDASPAPEKGGSI